MLHRCRKIVVLFIFFVVAGSLYGWWRRDELLGCYYFHQLNQADGAARETWVKKLVELDQAIRPQALECLCDSTQRICSGGEEVLAGLVRNWKDARSASLLKELLLRWPALSEPGRISALTLARVVLEESGDKSPIKFECELVRDLLQCAEGDNQYDRSSLCLALALTRLEPGEMPLQLLSSLSERGLRCADFDVRALALRLFLQPPFSKNDGLLARAVPFLQDVSAEVRRVSLLAVGSHGDLVSDDELLPLLHDADAEVCRLCETALRSRGLSDQHVVLARLISDKRPLARLEVLRCLETAGDLDAGVWLTRLCQDPAPAVRAAAVRAAAGQDVDLRDRLRDMAQNDASPTVRQLAGYYLQRGSMRQVRFSQ